MNDFINIDGKRLRLAKRENGHTMAYCDDLFRLVGLEGLCRWENTDRFYHLLGIDSTWAIKFSSYECDLRRELVCQKLKRYFIIDCGIRMTRTFNIDLQENDFEITRYYLELLDDTWYTRADVLEMLIDEGFNVTLNNF
ncbi:hypothetical protein [Draconibacterium sediminis]|uniref:Uncharacterized protein n=1 Tax=Draconibacterium sediminis TaxID=1544798 RepID=A0A0D8JAN7_9BACT|nr:hypothetical protein [Draconibacterium sediminis]KJF44065.1 hypothetical protein LH29_00555 [Draconibacterium sediminis]